MDSDTFVMHSAVGPATYALTAVCLILAAAVYLLIDGFLGTLFGLVLAVMALLIASYPFSVTYRFDEDKVTVHNPMGVNGPPAAYSSIYSVTDTDGEWVFSGSGSSSDAVVIRYDEGTGHCMCISAKDKERILRFLREKCPDAEFLTIRKKTSR